MENFDLIIIGAGPAGLTAGIYAKRSGLNTLILEEKLAGGEAGVTPLVENYPGFEAISGPELIERMVKHCRKFGAQINELEPVVSLDLEGKKRFVRTEKTDYNAPAIIIATGTRYRLLNIPGEKEFQGKGVSYCALCDGAFFKDKSVIVVGGGNSAAESARYLSSITSNIKLIHRKSQLRAEEAYLTYLKDQNVQFIWNTEVKQIKGGNTVKSVVLWNNKSKETSEMEIDGVFIQIGEVPITKIFERANIAIDERGYIIVDSRQRTNIPGVFAAGDVTNGPVKQIGTATGQAIVAATEAFGYIKRPYYYKEKD
ncbi:MAG: thioredoxin-disulfide reductase [Candidatus Bathyarchaeota archaeon]|nr:MAG: thioredoxin-disulfide reductase [Candidatus Bathyarchaeota archaeon]